MVLVTLTSAALSLRQNAELLAAFALVGGFLTPVLISTGQNHEIALFCYLALLDLGTLWITAIKQVVAAAARRYIGTAILAGAWAVTYYTDAQLTPTILLRDILLSALRDCAVLAPTKSRLRTLATRHAGASFLLNAAGYFAASYLMLLTSIIMRSWRGCPLALARSSSCWPACWSGEGGRATARFIWRLRLDF